MGKVTVTWWTHVIGGLHKNDFILADKCDRVAMLVTAPTSQNIMTSLAGLGQVFLLCKFRHFRLNPLLSFIFYP